MQGQGTLKTPDRRATTTVIVSLVALIAVQWIVELAYMSEHMGRLWRESIGNAITFGLFGYIFFSARRALELRVVQVAVTVAVVTTVLVGVLDIADEFAVSEDALFLGGPDTMKELLQTVRYISSVAAFIFAIFGYEATGRELADGVVRQQAILSATLDPMITIDSDGIIVAASDSSLRVLGWEPEELTGQPIERLVPEPHRSRHRTYMEHYLETGVGDLIGATREFEGIRKDGSLFPCEVTVARVDIPGQAFPLFNGVIRDITERKRAEEERTVYEEQLRHASRMEAIGTLAGGIAHDFRNVLAGIAGYTELALEDAEPGGELEDNLNEILNASERGKLLVQQILGFSKKGGERMVAVDLEHVVAEVLKFLRVSSHDNIEIWNQTRSSGGVVLADATQLHQVVMNLCTNAIAAMEPEGGRLELSLDSVEVGEEMCAAYPELIPGPYSALTVRDTGRGIAPEIMDRVFDPFFTTKESGTGIGLATVHSIVARHGGAVRLESTLGAGTTVSVYLPLVEGLVLERVEAESPQANGSGRILVVDDEEKIVKVMTRKLEAMGYTVTGQTSSVQAWAIFEEAPESFDLVITDQMMPRLTGTDMAEKMHRMRPGLPLILCSGFGLTVEEERLGDYGIREYLKKPISLSAFGAAVREVLDGKGVSA